MTYGQFLYEKMLNSKTEQEFESIMKEYMLAKYECSVKKQEIEARNNQTTAVHNGLVAIAATIWSLFS